LPHARNFEACTLEIFPFFAFYWSIANHKTYCDLIFGKLNIYRQMIRILYKSGEVLIITVVSCESGHL
jgi:hypothetical protein